MLKEKESSSSSEVEQPSEEEDSSEEDDAEDQLYANLLQAQNLMPALIDPKMGNQASLETIIDKDTKALLRACSMLRLPPESVLA